MILLCTPLFVTLANGQVWPEKPVTLVCASGPGSSMDVMVRQVAKAMEKHTNQQVIVLNKTGGANLVTMSYVQSQPADGYTLGTYGLPDIYSLLRKDVPLSMADLEPVACIHLDSFVLFVKEDGPYKTLDDFIRDAKSRPGQLTVSGFGSLGSQQICEVIFEQAAGIECKWMAFDSGGKAIVALLGDNVAASMGTAAYIPQFKGKLRLLAHSSEKPLENAPNVPMFKNLYGDKLVRYHWRGFHVKAGTPKPVIEQIHAVMGKVTQDPVFIEYTKSTGLIDGYMPLDQLRKFVQSGGEKDKPVLKRLGVELK